MLKFPWFSGYASCYRGKEKWEWVQVGPWVWAVSVFFFLKDLIDWFSHATKKQKPYSCSRVQNANILTWLPRLLYIGIVTIIYSFDFVVKKMVCNRYVLRCSWPEVPNGRTWLWGTARDGIISRRLDGQWHGNVFHLRSSLFDSVLSY